MGNIIVVGAGVAGLTLASKLSEHGINTVIIECEDHVGGLAYSYKYDNGAVFDIGPHRFHTDDLKVKNFIEDTLADNLITDEDPGFVNAAAADFRLRDNSLVYRKIPGFQRIPFEKIGPYPSRHRATWPVP